MKHEHLPRGPQLSSPSWWASGRTLKASSCFTLILSPIFFTMSTDTHQITDNQPVKNTVKAPSLLDAITIKNISSFRITKAPDPVQPVKMGRLEWGQWIGTLNGLSRRLFIWEKKVLVDM